MSRVYGTTSGGRQHPARRSRRAVLVDHDSGWLDHTEKLLGDLAVEVIARETSPEAALSCVEERQPDLLLVKLDSRPSGNGRPLLECLRLACERVPKLKAIAFGDADRITPEDVFDAGAVAYVDSSAAPEDVAAAVRQAFGRSLHFSWPPRE